MQFPVFTHLNSDAYTVPVTVTSVSWPYIRNAGYAAHVSTVMPTQNTCTDYCKIFKISTSKSVTYTDKVLQTVDCYFKKTTSQFIESVETFRLPRSSGARLFIFGVKPNLVCYSRETKNEKGLCCLRFTILYKPTCMDVCLLWVLCAVR